MKRRTKQNVGAWPNMRDDTLKAIADELSRARKKHPQIGHHISLLISHTSELASQFRMHNEPNGKLGSAAQIYALSVTVAAMAIRLIEEGSQGCRYVGNRDDAPKFELTP